MRASVSSSAACIAFFTHTKSDLASLVRSAPQSEREMLSARAQVTHHPTARLHMSRSLLVRDSER